ncbi:MAG: hypothetical protein R3A79_18500 [Nannocystaceae bacterium]
MSPSDDPKDQLKRLFRLREPEVGAPPSDLEDALVERLRRRTAAPAPTRRFAGFIGQHRFAFAGVALAMIFGACRLPVDYQRSFGASVRCVAEPDALDEAELQAMSRELEVAIAAESVALRIMRDEQRAQVRVDVWGDLEDEADALDLIVDLAPTLRGASCSAQAIEGTVHGTLGGRLGYSLLSLDVLDRKSAAEAREEILVELAAQGFAGKAEVQVEDDGQGQRKVMIRLEETIDSDGELPPLRSFDVEASAGADEVEVEHRVLRRDPAP